MFNFLKFPFFNSLGTLVATSCVTSHEITRTVSLSDCNRVNCRIYGIDDCNRCLQALKRAGHMERKHREVVIDVIFICSS